MKQNGYSSCEQVQSYYAMYPVPVAAMLWCGVPSHQIQDHLSKSTQTVVRGVFSNPYIPCLEPRCKAIHDAITNGSLPVCRENGRTVDEHVASERRHMRREDLKAWIAKEFPADKPHFLFDEIERKTHSAISTEAYEALAADRDAARASVREITRNRDELLTEVDSLKSCIEKMIPAAKEPGDRAETTYLNIISGLLGLMLGESPSGVKQSVFLNQAAIISALLGHYSNKPGISVRSLEDKFADAKKA